MGYMIKNIIFTDSWPFQKQAIFTRRCFDFGAIDFLILRRYSELCKPYLCSQTCKSDIYSLGEVKHTVSRNVGEAARKAKIICEIKLKMSKIWHVNSNTCLQCMIYHNYPLKLETTIFFHRMNHKHDVKDYFH